MSRTGYLYIVEAPSGNRYVGITTQTVQTRWQQHVAAAKKAKTRLATAIRKYGAENFTVRTLVQTSPQELNRLEPLAIQAYRTLSPDGYNLREGGERSNHSPESRKKISQASKNRWKNPQQRSAQGKRMRQQWKDPEFRDAHCSRLEERVWTEAQKDAVREGVRQYWTAERKAAQSERTKALWENPDYRAAQTKRMQEAWTDTEKREAWVESMKEACTEERRAAIGKAVKQAWTPERRAAASLRWKQNNPRKQVIQSNAVQRDAEQGRNDGPRPKPEDSGASPSPGV